MDLANLPTLEQKVDLIRQRPIPQEFVAKKLKKFIEVENLEPEMVHHLTCLLKSLEPSKE